ncbi:MAG: discoidin domain-containing protein, partial [Bacteroidia bacterium]|nr:discoidin domain-containing protein [Bacteroidia bacterium]
ESLLAFKELRLKEFSTEVARGKKINASHCRGKGYHSSNINDGDPSTYWSTVDSQLSADFTIDLGEPTDVNRILLQEYIQLGQRVQEFSVDALVDNEWQKVTEGTTIGYKVIRKFPVVKATRIKVTISKSKACPVISNVELFRAPGE